ncbi:hypothetical protein SAMN04487897_11472 [Paenibacillus sp. yr247]|uniref:hypothetical protein n=1 Tax=Paenibacillus sp. yr247 TaxID=1761880 RepID=UPI00088A2509|nr:hypothetical protein [Paenibacillus sp. yr247]SDO44350.1 hypothetical protein SAMN04487897_11472 [Paenibacillus sp. yr247]
MSYICPVCNGLQELNTECPVCSHQMNDCGRLSDYLGPYSPYREIDEISMSDGTAVQHDQCLHLVNCSDCHYSFTIQISS